MPELDFDQIASSIPGVIPGIQVDAIKAALMDVWNARGAADLAKLTLLDGLAGPGTVKILDRAIRSVDR